MQTLFRRLNRHRQKQKKKTQQMQKAAAAVVDTQIQYNQKPKDVAKYMVQEQNFKQNSLLIKAFFEQTQQQKRQSDVMAYINYMKLVQAGGIKKVTANIKLNHLEKIKTRKIFKRNKDLQRFRNNIYITRHPNGNSIPITRPQAIKNLRDPDVKWQMQNWFDRLYIDKYMTNDKGKVQINPIWYDKKNKFRQWMAFHKAKRQRQQKELMQQFKKNNLKTKLIQKPIQPQLLLNQSFGYVQPQFGQKQNIKQNIIQQTVLKQQRALVPRYSIKSKNVYDRVRQHAQQFKQQSDKNKNLQIVKTGFGVIQTNWYAAQYVNYVKMMQRRYYYPKQMKLSKIFQQQCMKMPQYKYILFFKQMIQKQQKQRISYRQNLSNLISQFTHKLLDDKFRKQWVHKVYDSSVIQRFHKMVLSRQYYWKMPAYLIGYGKQFAKGTEQQLKIQRYNYLAFIFPEQIYQQQQISNNRGMTLYAIQVMDLQNSLYALQSIKLIIQYMLMMLIYHLSPNVDPLQTRQIERQSLLTNRRLFINFRPNSLKPFTLKQIMYHQIAIHITQGLRAKRSADKTLIEMIIAWIARWKLNPKQNTQKQISNQMFMYCMNNFYAIRTRFEGFFSILMKCQVLNI